MSVRNRGWRGSVVMIGADDERAERTWRNRKTRGCPSWKRLSSTTPNVFDCHAERRRETVVAADGARQAAFVEQALKRRKRRVLRDWIPALHTAAGSASSNQ